MEKILKDIARSLKSIDDSLKKIERDLSRDIVINVDGCACGDDVIEKIEEELKKRGARLALERNIEIDGKPHREIY